MCNIFVLFDAISEFVRCHITTKYNNNNNNNKVFIFRRLFIKYLCTYLTYGPLNMKIT